MQVVFVTGAARWSDWGLLTLAELHVGQRPQDVFCPVGGSPASVPLTMSRFSVTSVASVTLTGKAQVL